MERRKLGMVFRIPGEGFGVRRMWRLSGTLPLRRGYHGQATGGGGAFRNRCIESNKRGEMEWPNGAQGGINMDNLARACPKKIRFSEPLNQGFPD
jgi:hypothetical protein